MMSDDDDIDAGLLGGSGDSPPDSPPPPGTRGGTGGGGTGGGSHGGSTGAWKGLESRPLTKLEKDNQDKAAQRHKASIGQTKV